jgi:hypothetical protein
MSENTPIKVIDVPGETLLVAVVYKDGNVHIETAQSTEWVAKALRSMADSVEVTPPGPGTGF